MLQKLKIKDLILIEHAEIELGAGLNIFTGETGSGKSAILTAIRLIAGERADSEWIRNSSSAAIVEAKLSSFSPELLGDIEPPLPGEPLTLRREIHRSGKSRCFVEEQLVSAGFLREFMRSEIEMIDQTSASLLCLPEEQRKMLDAFGDLENESAVLIDAFSKSEAAKQKLETSLAADAHRNRDLDWAQSNLQAIVEVGWQKEEEETLDQQHALLSHAQELIEKIGSVMDGLADSVPALHRLSSQLDGAVRIDERLRSSAENLKVASLELSDAERSLRSYAARIDADPARLSSIENRIKEIEKLKRRFGSSWDEVEKQKIKFAIDAEKLLSLDDAIADLKKIAGLLEEKTSAAARVLSEKRRKASPVFCKAVLAELKCLNLPHAQFENRISPKALSGNGVDEIQFVFSANPGVPPLPLDQAPSGGELSRLLFAAKTVLAQKDAIRCLVFDEIDSNVGGQTASVLGEKLKTIAEKRQVICVTHFVQVARSALHHYGVTKVDKEGRAATHVKRLTGELREQEYNRMIGN